MRLVPEEENEIKEIYDHLKEINREYVSEADMNGADSNGFVYGVEDEQESDEEKIEGQFDDADE